jgi:hypothetical protein
MCHWTDFAGTITYWPCMFIGKERATETTCFFTFDEDCTVVHVIIDLSIVQFVNIQ